MAAFINSYRDVKLRKTYDCNLCSHNSTIVPKIKCEIGNEMVCTLRCADKCGRCQRTVCLRHVMMCTLRDSEDCFQILCVFCAEEDFVSWGRTVCCPRAYGCPPCRLVHTPSECTSCHASICHKKKVFCAQDHIFCLKCYKKKVPRKAIWDNEQVLREVSVCEYCVEDYIARWNTSPCRDCELLEGVFSCVKCKNKICIHTSSTCGSRHRYCLKCSEIEIIQQVQDASVVNNFQSFTYKICKLCVEHN